MKKILITGGAGFIGINAAEYFLKKGYSVTILDNFSRKGARSNYKWLFSQFPKLKFIKGEIANKNILIKSVPKQDIVLHLAAQVSVTSSVMDPFHDFQINTIGTINLLEAIRKINPAAILLYSSTNKVYGNLSGVKIQEKATRYEFKDMPHGIPETHPVDFHSPYGCSKGAADQYVLDYARIYNLKTIVFRQSCIYGSHQFGIEDQGWVAWFIIAVLLGRPMKIFGDGKQVRDVLDVKDLVRAYDMAIQNINKTQGQAYNIGGGPRFALSVWKDFGPLLEKKLSRTINITYKNWRPGDQKIFISDTRKAFKDFKWKPVISPEKGVSDLINWVKDNIEILQKSQQ